MTDDTNTDDGELQFGIASNSLAEEPEDDGTNSGAEEPAATPSMEVEPSESTIENNRLEDEPRREVDPFEELPTDLDFDSLSPSGASEVAALDPDALYRATVEPYSFNRNRAHDQRKQDGIFLRESVGHAVDNIHSAMSHLYTEDKYHRADTLELLMMVALRHVDELPDVAADLGFGVNLETYMETRQK